MLDSYTRSAILHFSSLKTHVVGMIEILTARVKHT